ncbi:MAG: site-2 protease family protein, partial [bacterium]|nr:site-2 protease family protein [bacterium]
LLTYALAAGYFPQMFPTRSPAVHWLLGAVASLLLFVSVLIHELMHSVVAKRNNIPISGITLFIFGGASQMTDEPGTAAAEFKMAIVGPLTSLVLAVIFYAVTRLAATQDWGVLLVGLSLYLTAINFILAVFNLVPGFPLDGGRVLRSIIWRITGDLTRSTRIAAYVGIGIAYTLIFLGILSVLSGNLGGIWLVLIGWFLQNAAQRSYQQLLIRRSLGEVKVRQIMTRDVITVPADITLDRLVEDYFFRYKHATFPVLRDGRLIGLVVFNDIKDVPRELWSGTTAGQTLRELTPDLEIAPDDDAYDALERIAQGDAGRLLVIGDAGLEGIVSRKDIAELISMKEQTGG